MTAAEQQIQELLDLANNGENPNIQPCILANMNIDPTKITAITSVYVNSSWVEQTDALLKDGYVIFRIQTEFGSLGHYTVAYLAKLSA